MADRLGVDEMDFMSLQIAGAQINSVEMKPQIEETMRQYNANKHKLPTCPKEGCEGKLHQTVAISEEFNGLYHCDSCESLFRRKS